MPRVPTQQMNKTNTRLVQVRLRGTWKRLLNPLLTVSLTPSICTGNSSLHFRWHSSNVPGLGRQPQPPSSEAPAAPPVAAPGVRSEPRPALDPVPRPPPIGGSVKPGGEGGGGGNPTRDGVGGGGGPAGGELAANTFPMVLAAAAPVPGLGSDPTPCAPRNRTHCRRRGCFPAPWNPLVNFSPKSAHHARSEAFYWSSGRKYHPSR